MIIGISGKIGSGKDTTAHIIRWLTNPEEQKSWNYDLKSFIDFHLKNIMTNEHNSGWNWQIKKFADKLKDIVCLLIGCTRQQLEDQEFKNKELGEEWTNYAYATGFTTDNNGKKSMLSTPCSKERYEEERRINWQTAYKRKLTPRLLLQLIGTECGRNIIHPNIWINSLFSDYKIAPNISIGLSPDHPYYLKKQYPNWIITDVRFPNEANAIKDRDGILLRVNRILSFMHNKSINAKEGNFNEHESETALDDYKDFDYEIDNNSSIESLMKGVKYILGKEKLL